MNETKRIPRHIAIIMDGNGRWAQQRGKERFEGHIQGVESVRRAIKSSAIHGVEFLTLYAFSTENWGRPTEEVNALMELICKSIELETPELVKQGVKMCVIGSRDRFSAKVQQSLSFIEQSTADGKTLCVILALNYSSRDEITRAMQGLARRVEAGEISPEQIDEQTISQSLDTAQYPDPDLIIRTSGECRLSNFLMWQASYAELYFPDVLWPDFDDEQYVKALEVYAARDRRFGLVK